MSPTKRLLNLPVEPEGIKKKNTKVALATANKSPRARHLLKKYGITDDDYQTLLARQRECCAICGRHSRSFQKRLAIDHDHTPLTGEVRGLVCTHCNRYVLGRYKRKDVELLKSLISYLDREYTGWVVPPKKKRRKKHARRKRL